MVQAKKFGSAATKGKKSAKNFAPVRRVWDSTKLSEAVVDVHRKQISVSIVDDPTELAKKLHRAVMEWRELTNLEHPGKVYLETEVVKDSQTLSSDGTVMVEIMAYVVVETAPDVSAR